MCFRSVWGSSGGGGSVISQAIVETSTVTASEEIKAVEIPKEVDPSNSLAKSIKFTHTVTFGISAAWINSYNVKQLRKFMDSVLQKVEVSEIVVRGYSQPTKIQLANLDLARAKAVVKLLKNDGVSARFVVEKGGVAPSKSGDKSRIAVVLVEGVERI